MYSDMTVLALLTGVLVPLLVGLLTKLNASSGIKATLNLGLTALGAVLATTNEINWDTKAFLINWGVAWTISVGTYYGFYKPTTISQSVQEAAPDVGIG